MKSKLTPAEQLARSNPHRSPGDKLFYISYRCSFHDNVAHQHIHGILLTRLLKALEKTGALREWNERKKRKGRP